MPSEASKTKSLCPDDIIPYLKGKGIDIGCGSDPVFSNVRGFDLKDGDANKITDYVKDQYDFVFSSHALEHMDDPVRALEEWFSILRPGGHLVVLVPDEDLYEQGIFPSVFNYDHKFTFTISKSYSWSPKSINVIDLVNHLPGTLVKLKLQDNGYDRRYLSFRPSFISRILGRIFQFVWVRVPALEKILVLLAGRLSATIDQTQLSKKMVLAQILFVVRKND